jgi:hypothetical protein
MEVVFIIRELARLCLIDFALKIDLDSLFPC